MREALENLQAPYDGMMKSYSKPFSADCPRGARQGLPVGLHWKDGKLLPYSDDVIKLAHGSRLQEVATHAGPATGPAPPSRADSTGGSPC